MVIKPLHICCSNITILIQISNRSILQQCCTIQMIIQSLHICCGDTSVSIYIAFYPSFCCIRFYFCYPEAPCTSGFITDKFDFGSISRNSYRFPCKACPCILTNAEAPLGAVMLFPFRQSIISRFGAVHAVLRLTFSLRQ